MGSTAQTPFDPPLWHESYEQSRTLLEDNLFLTAPQMGIIMKLWDEIREKYIVNLPQDDREAQSLDWRPQTIEMFQENQLGAINDIRDYIIDEWLPEIVNVFNEADRTVCL